MSLINVKTIFENLSTCTEWSIQLFNIKVSSTTQKVGYSSRAITLNPQNRVNELINDVKKIYLGDGKKQIETYYQEVREYDGTADARIIYKLNKENELLKEEYTNFIQIISNPNVEGNPFNYTSAYLLKGEIIINDSLVPATLISMQKPVTLLQHKFYNDAGTFKELKDEVLSLKPTMDVLIVGDIIYFLTLAGENLFNMIRSYKIICQNRLQEIEKADIIMGIDEFKKVASSGHNPRKFVSFNEAYLKVLQEPESLTQIAEQFKIPVDSFLKKFDGTTTNAAEKIVKLLCGKGMLDPFVKTAVEVDGSRNWK